MIGMKQPMGEYGLGKASISVITVIAWMLLPAAAIQAEARDPLFAPAGRRQEGPQTLKRSDGPANPHEKKPAVAADTVVTLDNAKYDLAKSEELKAFIQSVKDLDALAKKEHAESKSAKKRDKKSAQVAGDEVKGSKKRDKKPAETSDDEVKDAKGKDKKDWSSKKIRYGLKAMEHIAIDVRDGKRDSATGIHELQEIAWAVESNFVIPYFWRPSLDFGDLLFRARDITLNASGRGNANDPASNLLTYDAADLSKVDPKPSTFWSRPAHIAEKNLYTGFDRASIPDFTDSVCTYEGPHKGYGVHPSFEVTWHDKVWKVKFGEERSSGPFGCRIFWALGFPVEIVDYTPEIKVSWDKRILSKFNSRQLNEMQIKVFGLHVATQRLNPYYDPFDYIKYAMLKDGTKIGVQELRNGIFPATPGNSKARHPETKPSLYNKTFESKIDYVVMKDASVTSKEKDDSTQIGFWDYNGQGHPRLREVRGLAILDAWLDNWDVRWGNNRLDLVEEQDGTYRLEHHVSDLGALFGNSSGLLRMVHGKWKQGLYQNAPNDFGWAFTHGQAPVKTTVPICDYMPDSKTMPFYEMNLDDARWMARLMAQLTEDQLKSALIGAGYDATTARFLFEKLVARRDQMIKDFGLGGEIAQLRPQGVNRRLSYNPEVDGPFEISLAPGSRVAARNSGEFIVLKGELKRTADLKRGGVDRTAQLGTR